MTDKKKDGLIIGATFSDISDEDVEQLVQRAKDIQPPNSSLEDEVKAALAESDLNEEDIHKAIFESGDDETPADENPPPSWLDDLGM